MRILVVHAWLKGNLGDVLQLSVLLRALRGLQPDTLDLAGYPVPPAAATADLIAIVDRLIPDPFWWFWKFSPALLASAVIAPRWQQRRRALFAHYDVIVCAPGPYLAAYDPRAIPALADIRIARDSALPVILSSHSIGPLAEPQLADVRRASVCVSREVSTHHYLTARACPNVLAADYAFLYPYEANLEREPDGAPYEVLFLRSDNLPASGLRFHEGQLHHGDHCLAGGEGRRLVLATSDARRDARFVRRLGRRFGLDAVVCQTVPALVRLVAGASAVVSDRYHPAICAAVLGIPVRVVPNHEPHKMDGLTELLSAHSIDHLQALARTGLSTVLAGLHSRH